MFIPEGYTHQTELINRGWKSAQIAELLKDSMVKIELPAGTVNVSNKAYSNVAIESIENGDITSPTAKEVRKQIVSKGMLITSTTQATEENTVGRAALLGKGWSIADIKNFLAYPDLTLSSITGYGEQHRYLIERVTEAETKNAKLAAKVSKKKGEKEETIKTAQEEGKVVFRKVSGEWVIAGINLIKGQTVTVSKKNGETEKVVVNEIVSTNGEVQTATFKKSFTAKQSNTVNTVSKETAKPTASVAVKEEEVTATSNRNYTFIVEGDVHEAYNALNATAGTIVEIKGEIVKVTAIEVVRKRLMGIDDDFYTATLQNVSAVLADENEIASYNVAVKEEARKNDLRNNLYKAIRNNVVAGEVQTATLYANAGKKFDLDIVDVRIVGAGKTAYIEDVSVPNRKIIFSQSMSIDGDSWGSYNGGNEIISVVAFTADLEEAIKIIAAEVAV